MTSYDGNTITYDTIGNPLTDGTWSYTWEQGRKLTKMQGSAGTWNYTYNSDGMRISRTSLTDSYSYWYDGDGRLLRMKYNDIVMSFSYSANGQPMSITYNGAVYYYLINAQGDVMGLVDSSGNMVVNYLYDAWGRVIRSAGSMSTTLGRNNPLRYRSYIYDHETGLYYLQSRYYNPTWGRFINADGQLPGVGGNVIGYNLFAYCLNNPVNMSDPLGNWPSWRTIFKAVTIVAAAAAIVTAVTVSIATFGLTSIASTMVISSAVTLTARATEAAVLQGRKSSNDGKSVGQIVTDIVDAVFDNGGRIIGKTPVTKTAGYAAGFYSQSSTFKDVINLQKIDGFNFGALAGTAKYEVANRFTNFTDCVSADASKVGMFMAYGGALLETGNMLFSIFADDPERRAASRGYILK